MRASTILLATFVIWLLAKDRLNQYWALATTGAVGAGSAPNSGPGDGVSMFPSSPGLNLNLDEIWKTLTGKKPESGGGGW